jgi:hypothetical protein
MNFFQNIREMQPTDLVGVVNFWNRIEGIGMSPDDNPDALSSYLAHNPGLSFVAFDGEELVGAVLCGQDERRGVYQSPGCSEITSQMRPGGEAGQLLPGSMPA